MEHYKSSPYRPQANGAVEAPNKNVKKILSKMTQTYRDWSDRLQYALWGYRTIVRTLTGATPFSLVYGSEAVLPIEVDIRSLRTVIESELPEVQWAQERHNSFTTLDSHRLKVLYHTQLYQARLARAFNKKMKHKSVKAGDWVLKQAKPFYP